MRCFEAVRTVFFDVDRGGGNKKLSISQFTYWLVRMSLLEGIMFAMRLQAKGGISNVCRCVLLATRDRK